jgi:hypothetical protein
MHFGSLSPCQQGGGAAGNPWLGNALWAPTRVNGSSD